MAKSSRTVVVKIGGEILGTDALLEEAMQEIARMKRVDPGINVILVHGAGPQIDRAFRESGIEIQRIGGKRVSTEKGMGVIWDEIRKDSEKPAQILGKFGIRAEPIDFPLTTLARINDKRLGLVGVPIGVNLKHLRRVLGKGGIPIVSICGVTKQKQTVNVNADEVAAAIAAAMKADKLEFKTTTGGIGTGKTVGRILLGEQDHL